MQQGMNPQTHNVFAKLPKNPEKNSIRIISLSWTSGNLVSLSKIEFRLIESKLVWE